MKKYYEILAISSTATLSELKTAFRIKALAHHPSKNTDPEVQETFFNIVEAYYVLSFIIKKGKSTPAHQKKRAIEQQKEKVQKKAQEYAQLSYEEFKQNKDIKISAVTLIWNQFHLISAYFLVLGLIPTGYFLLGKKGIYFALIVLFFSISYWKVIFNKNAKFNFRDIPGSLKTLSRTPIIHVFVLMLYCLYAFFAHFSNTVVPHLKILLGVGGGAFVLLLYLVFRLMKMKETRFLGYFLVIPLSILMLVFSVNYWFSSRPIDEVYSFSRLKQNVRSGGRTVVQQTTYIYLDGEKYDDSYGIRFFPDNIVLNGKNKILYSFETGLFGMKVLKSYSFYYVNEH